MNSIRVRFHHHGCIPDTLNEGLAPLIVDCHRKDESVLDELKVEMECFVNANQLHLIKYNYMTPDAREVDPVLHERM